MKQYKVLCNIIALQLLAVFVHGPKVKALSMAMTDAESRCESSLQVLISLLLTLRLPSPLTVSFPFLSQLTLTLSDADSSESSPNIMDIPDICHGSHGYIRGEK